MPRHFKVHELLSKAELEALEAFTREPGRTVDEIEEWLQAAGFNISRGAVWAWRNNFLANDRFEAAGDLARTVIEAGGRKDMPSIADAASKQLAQMIFEASIQMQLDGSATSKDICNLTAAYKNAVTGTRHLETLKEEMAARQKLAVTEAEKLAKAGAGGAAVVAKVRELLGIDAAA